VKLIMCRRQIIINNHMPKLASLGSLMVLTDGDNVREF